MERLQDLIGRELEADGFNRALRNFAQSQRTSTVGAVHVTCSDESEHEAVASFQHWFADAVLPELKSQQRSPFRTANLGARYEWGAIRIAEEHYATPETRDSVKLMVIKLNSHVAVTQAGNEVIYGMINRYDCESACCGALHALLAGRRHPAMDELRATFGYDDVDRLGMLQDPETTAPSTRPFVAGVINARLQARSAIVDIQDYEPETPTIYVVIPCVTLNRPQRDTEFVVGVYWADTRKGVGEAEYVGLGDNPSHFELSKHHGYLRVEDASAREPRAAHDHRQEVVKQWRERYPVVQTVDDPRLRELAAQTQDTQSYTATMTRETLKTMLWLAADIAPVPISILLFAKGIAGIHNLYRAHQLARGTANVVEAQEIIEEVTDQMASLPVDRARSTINAIMEHIRT